MIKLTRRTLLVGASALMAAGTVSFRSRAASRTYHALLVACTEYPALPRRNWLIGPKNDADLVHEYLLKNVPDPVRFAPRNVTLLAKDVPGAKGLPTHAAIKAALADLAAKVQRDDFVYLHLSGHGAVTARHWNGGRFPPHFISRLVVEVKRVGATSSKGLCARRRPPTD